MARRMDRRVQRTRNLLKEALKALILDEGYDSASIQDITEKANLGRATFYLHYKDKDELLADLMDQQIGEFTSQVPQISGNEWWMDDAKALTKLFDFAAERYDLYRILLIGKGGIPASRQLQRSIAGHISAAIQHVVEDKGNEPVEPAAFIANHFAGSLLSTIYWWLENDLTFSAEDMAAMLQKINPITQGRLFGPDPSDEEKPPEPARDKRKKKRKPKETPAPEGQKGKEDSQPETKPHQADKDVVEG